MSSLGYTTKAFNKVAKSETGFGFGLEKEGQKTQQKAANKTILQSLGSKIKTNFSASGISATSNIKSSGVGAASQLEKSKAQISNIKAEAGNVKAVISSEIRQAQGEIAAQLKEMGQSYKSIFPDQRVAAGGEAEFVGNAFASTLVLGFANAKGSFSTFAKKMLSGADTLFSSLKGGGAKNRDRIITELQERLVEQSQPVDTRMDNTGPLVDTSSPQNESQTKFDWKSFFEDGGDLAKLPYADPDNPAPGIFPEWDNANNIEGSCKRAEAILSGVEADIEKNGFEKGGSDPKQVYAQSDNDGIREQFNQLNSDYIDSVTSGSLAHLSGVRIGDIEDIAALDDKDVKDSLPSLHHEPPIRKMLDFSKPPMTSAA